MVWRAAVIASQGMRRAQASMTPFCVGFKKENKALIKKLEALCGITLAERAAGFEVCIATQVGTAKTNEQIHLGHECQRRLSTNLLAFRSERIQPGVNQEQSAPAAYQVRQDMDVSEALTVMAGRAAYNAFSH